MRAIQSDQLDRKTVGRFNAKVNRAPGLGPNGDCWEWTGAIFRAGGGGGYGAFWLKPQNIGAHRVSYAITHGDVPADLMVLHRCDNRKCVRPDHLFLGDHAANMADMSHKDRSTHGSRNGNSALTEEQVADIRREYAAGGVSQEATAARYGVDRTLIGMIARGEIWERVEGPILTERREKWWRSGPPARQCSIEGCERRHHAKGLCSPHFSQARRAGRAA